MRRYFIFTENNRLHTPERKAEVHQAETGGKYIGSETHKSLFESANLKAK